MTTMFILLYEGWRNRAHGANGLVCALFGGTDTNL